MRPHTAVRAAVTTAILLLAAPAGVAHADEPPACAAENLAWLDAEDQAAAQSEELDAAKAALADAQRDADTLTRVTNTLGTLVEAFRTPRTYDLFKLTLADLSRLYKPHSDARLAASQRNAAGVADAVQQGADVAQRLYDAVPSNISGSVQGSHVKYFIDNTKKAVAEARDAVLAAEVPARTDAVNQAQEDLTLAIDAVTPARAAYKTCLQNTVTPPPST
ncbi:MAG TPA: hypothetical protein VIU15_23100 [Streptomyces sp.]